MSAIRMGLSSNFSVLVAALVLMLPGLPRPVHAEGEAAAAEKPPAAAWTSQEYLEEVWNREKLTGDWLGLRTEMAERGLDFEVTLSHFGQWVASGGVESPRGAYGGKADFRWNLDATKLAGLWEGLAFNVHAESRWGNDILGDAGAFTLPNAPLLYPLPGGYDGTELTGLLAIQDFAGGKYQVLVGKLHAFDMVTGLFPNVVDYGLKGFINANAYQSILPWGRWLNLSQLGVAAWKVTDGLPTTGAMAVGQSSTTDNWDIDDSFGSGVGLMVFHRFVWEMEEKLGYIYVGVGASTKQYGSFDPKDFTDIPGGGLTDTSKKTPWSVAVYLYQKIWQAEKNDKRFAQLFMGFSVADENPSFARWDVFGSVELFGAMASRSGDRIGIAGWYTKLTDDFQEINSDVGNSLRGTWGFETYYNIEINPWLHLTPDIQFVMNQNNGDNLAVIPGIRLVIDF